jgi:hypothetical protein
MESGNLEQEPHTAFSTVNVGLLAPLFDPVMTPLADDIVWNFPDSEFDEIGLSLKGW